MRRSQILFGARSDAGIALPNRPRPNVPFAQGKRLSEEGPVDDLDRRGNGHAYSMTSSFRYAACIKRAAAYTAGNNTTVTNSYIHDNAWVGLWCDYCKYGLFDIENNRIIHNGSIGIQWEMSGGWTGDDRANIRNNVIQGNNYLEAASFRGGIGISSANDFLGERVRHQSRGRREHHLFSAQDATATRLSRRHRSEQHDECDRALGCSMSGVSCAAKHVDSLAT